MSGRNLVAAGLAIAGAGFFFGNFAYEAHLRAISPSVPTVASGEVIPMGKGAHFFVTSSENILSECIVCFGFLLWMVAIAMFQRLRESPKL
jgi:hypothetical protein